MTPGIEDFISFSINPICWPPSLVSALYPGRPAIGKRFSRTFSEGIRNGPNCLDWLSRGPSAGTPLWIAVARRRFGSAPSAPFLQPPPSERPKLTQNRKRRRATALQNPAPPAEAIRAPANASFRVPRLAISAHELNSSGTSDAASRLWAFILPSQSFIPPEHRTQGLTPACDSHLSFGWLSSSYADNTSPATFPRPTMVSGKRVIHSTNNPSPITPVFPKYAPDPFFLLFFSIPVFFSELRFPSLL